MFVKRFLRHWAVIFIIDSTWLAENNWGLKKFGIELERVLKREGIRLRRNKYLAT